MSQKPKTVYLSEADEIYARRTGHLPRHVRPMAEGETGQLLGWVQPPPVATPQPPIVPQVTPQDAETAIASEEIDDSDTEGIRETARTLLRALLEKPRPIDQTLTLIEAALAAVFKVGKILGRLG